MTYYICVYKDKENEPFVAQDRESIIIELKELNGGYFS